MRVRPTAGNLSGAVADLGVMVPLVAALVLINGLARGGTAFLPPLRGRSSRAA
jgi:hypothetical protein